MCSTCARRASARPAGAAPRRRRPTTTTPPPPCCDPAACSTRSCLEMTWHIRIVVSLHNYDVTATHAAGSSLRSCRRPAAATRGRTMRCPATRCCTRRAWPCSTAVCCGYTCGTRTRVARRRAPRRRAREEMTTTTTTEWRHKRARRRARPSPATRRRRDAPHARAVSRSSNGRDRARRVARFGSRVRHCQRGIDSDVVGS